MHLPALLPTELRVSGLTALLQVFSNTSLKCTRTVEGSAFLPPSPPPKAFDFLGEVAVVFLCLLTSTKLPDGISMLCKETGAFY